MTTHLSNMSSGRQHQIWNALNNIFFRAETENNNSSSSSFGAYAASIKNLLTDIPFLLLIISYGLNVGVYYAVSTLLVPLIKPSFFDEGSVNTVITNIYYSSLTSSLCWAPRLRISAT